MGRMKDIDEVLHQDWGKEGLAKAAVDAFTPDEVHHPAHYTHLPVEAIDITEHFNFCMGNAIKYIIRADHKGNPIQDLRKAAWYINKEIERRISADLQL